MTYCVGIRLKDGMIFASDTRTNAGVDQISMFRKMYQYGIEGERFLVLQTAGNLATSQAVFTKLDNAIKLAQERNLHTVSTLYDAAQLVSACEKPPSMPKPSHKKRIPNLEAVLFWVGKSRDNPPKFILSTLKAIASEQQPIRLFSS